MDADTVSNQFHEAIKTYFCTTDVQNMLIAYSDASSISRNYLLSLPSAVFHA